MGAAFAQDEAGDAFGYTADDVAVNSGAVLYWYAHGYANAWGDFPASFAAMVDKGLPLRTFNSAHTGDAIDPDDGSLDFDGDIMYVPGDGCGDVQVHVQTSHGVVNIPMDNLVATSDISGQFGPCCDMACPGCCNIAICDHECWNLCDNTDAACKIVQWIMWRSFETHECMYGKRPASEAAFYASGLAPVDANYKEYVPTMTIEYVVKGGCDCCYIKKAYVECCAPCVPCSPCAKTTCGSKCGGCGGCDKPKCGCSKPKCGCKSKCGSKCGGCNKCETKSACGCKDKCANKCNKCNKCESKCGCKDKCGCSKPKCGGCDKPKCGCSKPKCGCGKEKCGCSKPKCGCKDKCGCGKCG
ncbi:MAG: hypothetical protein R3F46_06945 [bacterium]